MIRRNSKKYFRESILLALPKKYASRNPQLIDRAIEVLACRIPRYSEFPKKLKSYLENHNLSKMAFEELKDFLKGRIQLNGDEIRYVKFIEQEIIGYCCYQAGLMVYSSSKSKYDEEEELLSSLRTTTPKGVVNTCCYFCGKTLERRNAESEYFQRNPHRCSKRENLDCFSKKEKLVKQNEFEWSLIRNERTAKINRQVCARSKCSKPIIYSLDKNKNHIHNELSFCSERCWETYRKGLQRLKENKAPETTSSLPV